MTSVSNHRVLVVVATWCVAAQARGPASGDTFSLPDGGIARYVPAPPPFPVGTAPPEQHDPLYVDVAINESNTDVVFRGQPLLFVGTATLAELSSNFVLPSTLTLKVLRADGGSADWPLERLTPVAGPRALKERTGVLQASWFVDETRTATIAEGHYVVRIECGRFSRSHPFQVVARPPTLSASEQTFATIRRAEALVARRQPAKALGAVNTALSVDPTNVTLLTHKAILLEAAGELDLAFQAAQAAQRQFYLENPNPAEPPELIDEVTHRLMDKLLKLGPKP
jgi:hypothetical protein